MTRPELNTIPINQAFQRGRCTVTMSPGQWDALLEAAYSHGAVLLELDWNENPVAAYRKSEGGTHAR